MPRLVNERLARPGNEQYGEVKGEFARYAGDRYVEPGFVRKPLVDHVEGTGAARVTGGGLEPPPRDGG